MIPQKASITIITATLNAASTIGRLSCDILSQTDRDFKWIIIDGGSVDNTIECLPKNHKTKIKIIQETDRGIYDAINKGVQNADSEYYLVVGADDRVRPNAIEKYRELALQSRADLISASVIDSGEVALPGRGKPWLRGQNAFISHHSVGVLIRRELHDKCGFYNINMRIASDQLFIKKTILNGSSLHVAPEFIAGEFTRAGISSTKYTATLFEFTLVQLMTEKSKNLQVLIFICRLFYNWRKLCVSV